MVFSSPVLFSHSDVLLSSFGLSFRIHDAERIFETRVSKEFWSPGILEESHPISPICEISILWEELVVYEIL